MPQPSLPQDPDQRFEPIEDPPLPPCCVEGCDEQSMDAIHCLQGVTLNNITDDAMIEVSRGKDEFYLCENHWIDFDHLFACFVLNLSKALPIVKCPNCGGQAEAYSCLCQKCGVELVKCNEKLKKQEILDTPNLNHSNCGRLEALNKLPTCPHIDAFKHCNRRMECVMQAFCSSQGITFSQKEQNG